MALINSVFKKTNLATKQTFKNHNRSYSFFPFKSIHFFFSAWNTEKRTTQIWYIYVKSRGGSSQVNEFCFIEKIVCSSCLIPWHLPFVLYICECVHQLYHVFQHPEVLYTDPTSQSPTGPSSPESKCLLDFGDAEQVILLHKEAYLFISSFNPWGVTFYS